MCAMSVIPECPRRMLLCDVAEGLVGGKVRLMGVVVSQQTQRAKEEASSSTTMITLDDGTALLNVTSHLGAFGKSIKIQLGDTIDCVGKLLMSTGPLLSLAADSLSVVVDPHAETLRQLEIIKGCENYISKDENYAMNRQNLFRVIQSAVDVDNRGLSESDLTVLLGIHRNISMIGDLQTTLQQMQADGEIYVDSEGGFVPL